MSASAFYPLEHLFLAVEQAKRGHYGRVRQRSPQLVANVLDGPLAPLPEDVHEFQFVSSESRKLHNKSTVCGSPVCDRAAVRRKSSLRLGNILKRNQLRSAN